MKIHLFLFFLLLCGCSRSDVIDWYIVDDDIKYNIKYGVTDLNQLDVYTPAICADPCPVLIFVHGGSWCYSDRKFWWKDSKINFFRQNGFVSVVIDYRKSPYPYELFNNNRIKHPVHVQDVAAAIKWVKSHIGEYGGDPDRIFLLGHSAGAHLVALVSTNERFLNEQGLTLKDVKGVCTLDAGAYLTVDKKLLFVDDSLKNEYKDLKYAYMNAFGVDSAGYFDANPYQHIQAGKKIPPFFLLYQNDSMRIKPNVDFVRKMLNNGYNVSGYCVSSYDHIKMFSSIGTEGDTENIGKSITDFFRKLN